MIITTSHVTFLHTENRSPSTDSTLPKVTEKQQVSRDQGDGISLPASSLGRRSKPGQRARWSWFASQKSPVQLCARGREIKAGRVAGSREEIKCWYNDMHDNSPPSTFSGMKVGPRSDHYSCSFCELTLRLPFALPDGSHTALPRRGRTGRKWRCRNVVQSDSFPSTATTSVEMFCKEVGFELFQSQFENT